METNNNRQPIFHELKVNTLFFPYLITDLKCYEIRKNDRDYRVGDVLILKEWDPDGEKFTGRLCTREVVYMLSNEDTNTIGAGFVIMTLIKY